MGGRSSSSASTQYNTSTSTSTENTSLNSALSGDVEEGAIALAGHTNNATVSGSSAGDNSTALDGSNNVINVTDGGALDLVRDVMSGVGGIVTALAENQAEVMGQATTLAGASVANMAAATGADPVTVKKPTTEKTKLYYALAAAGAVAVGAGAYAYSKR